MINFTFHQTHNRLQSLASLVLFFGVFGLSTTTAQPTVDVLVLYTPAVRDHHGGSEDGVLAQVNAAIFYTNQAYSLSGIAGEVRLVHLTEINYSEDQDTLSNDLKYLSDSTYVHNLRDAWGADMVCLFRLESAGEAAGMAYLLEDTDGEDDRAFSVVGTEYALFGTFAHELGHNMGAHHARGDEFDDEPSWGGLFSYSNGYRFGGSESNKYRTIMAYSPGNRIKYFSNPDVNYLGSPTGKPESDPESADNARTLNQTIPVVAAYREPVLNIDPASYTAIPEGESYTITIMSNSSWTVSESLEWATVSPISGNGNGSVTVTIEENTGTEERSGIIYIGGQEHTVTQEASISIPDGNLETAIRNALGKPTGGIAEEDMLTLSTLDSGHTHNTNESLKIADLTGLEYATNLTELSLEYNQIEDISVLGGLTNLTSLILYENQITDISSLSSLINLTSLILHSNQISDIGALSSLTDLQGLYLWNNQISDISALSGLINLTVLNLNTNQIGDIAALSGLTNLTQLYLHINQISDITALTDLTNLTNIFLSYNNLWDVEQIGSANNEVLTGLVARGASVTYLPQYEWISIDPGAYTAKQEGEDYTITISSNISWTVSESLEWATVSPNLGSGNGEVTVTVEANTGIGQRIGSISIGGQEHTLTQTGITNPGIFSDISVSHNGSEVGTFTFLLEYEKAPKAVANFVGLAIGERGWYDYISESVKFTRFYDGIRFHRIVADFVIQGGTPNAVDDAFPDDPGYSFPDQFDPALRHDAAGILSMAHSGHGSSGSQFFITLTDTPFLDDVHTVFGKVFSGLDVIQAVGVLSDQDEVIMDRVEIRRVGEAAMAFDIHDQKLPVVRNESMRIIKSGSQFKLEFSPVQFSVTVLQESANLVDWTSEFFDFQWDAPVLFSRDITTEINGQNRYFFRAPVVVYQETLFTPESLVGRKIILNSNRGYDMEISLVDSLGGNFTFPEFNIGGTVNAFLWERDPYRGRLLLSLSGLVLSGAPLSNATFSMSFQADGMGIYSGNLNSGVQSMDGTFTVQDL